MTTVTPRRPLTAEYELRGHLAATLTRAQQDELLARVRREILLPTVQRLGPVLAECAAAHGAMSAALLSLNEVVKSLLEQLREDSAIVDPRPDDRCACCQHQRIDHSEATVAHACQLGTSEIRCGCSKFEEADRA
jgi:hypothetical protein